MEITGQRHWPTQRLRFKWKIIESPHYSLSQYLQGHNLVIDYSLKSFKSLSEEEYLEITKLKVKDTRGV